METPFSSRRGGGSLNGSGPCRHDAVLSRVSLPWDSAGNGRARARACVHTLERGPHLAVAYTCTVPRSCTSSGKPAVFAVERTRKTLLLCVERKHAWVYAGVHLDIGAFFSRRQGYTMQPRNASHVFHLWMRWSLTHFVFLYVHTPPTNPRAARH